MKLFSKILAMLFITLPCVAEQLPDKELGEQYIYCGQVIIYTSQAGGASEENIRQTPAMLMTTLGAFLLNIEDVNSLKPYIDSARAKVPNLAKSPTAHIELFNAYSDCISLNTKETPALLERYKAYKSKSESIEPKVEGSKPTP